MAGSAVANGIHAAEPRQRAARPNHCWLESVRNSAWLLGA
jgi:hypothetical protein